MYEDWVEWAYRAKEYLHGVMLSYREFPSDRDDHVHCEICRDRISNSEDDLHGGYYEAEHGSWVCADCFRHCKELFGWKEANERTSN